MTPFGPSLLAAGFSFVVFVVAVYVGTTMALRGFFGREYYDPRTGERVGESDENDEGDASGAESEN